MPTLDDKGKPLSGAAKRKRAKAQNIQMLQDEEHRQASGKESVFKDFPSPPLDDTAKAIVWMNRALLVSTYGVMQDEEMTFKEKSKYVLEAVGKSGMIRDKVSEQEKIEKVTRALNEQKTTIGLEDVSQFPTPTISRPPG